MAERNYKNTINKIIATGHAYGKSRDDIRKDVNNFLAKCYAIRDISIENKKIRDSHIKTERPDDNDFSDDAIACRNLRYEEYAYDNEMYGSMYGTDIFDADKSNIFPDLDECILSSRKKPLHKLHESKSMSFESRFKKYVNDAVDEIKSMDFMKKFGIDVYFNEGYEFEQDDCALARIDSEMTEQYIESGSPAISFGVNIQAIKKGCRRLGISLNDEYELRLQALANVAHEIAHGIVMFIKNGYINEFISEFGNKFPATKRLLSSDEEDVAEEFADYMVGYGYDSDIILSMDELKKVDCSKLPLLKGRNKKF